MTASAVRHPRPAADRHHPARGQRRHRQDLDDRRARHPLRRRGRRARSSRCWSSPSAGPRARSCASGSARQLVEAERALAATRRPTRPPPTDLLDLLLDADEAERGARHAAGRRGAGRLRRRHHRDHPPVLLDGARVLGVAGDTDARARLVENLDDLVVEVVDDLYLRAFAYARRATRSSATPRRWRSRAPSSATRRRGSSRPGPTADTAPAAGSRFARGGPRRARPAQAAARRAVLRRPAQPARRRAGRPDDAPARARMRERWRIVLVDEFQDTDPVQWQVLDRAFSGHATMVLIGDPKQAIYAFRGGDVATYLAAAGTAATRQTLGVNWRSDRPLLDALQALLARRRARRRADRRAPGRRPPRRQPAGRAPRPRTVPAAGGAPRRSSGARHRAAHGRPGRGRTIARDLAADVARLLASRRDLRRATARAARRRGASATATPTSHAAREALARGRGTRRVSRAAAACSPPRPPSSGSPCWRRSSSRTGRPGAGGRAHAASSARPRRARRGRRRPDRRDRRPAARLGRRVSRTAGVAAVLEAASTDGLPGAGARPRSAASGASPTCATSARRSTRWPSSERLGRGRRCSRGCATQVAEAPRRPRAERTRRLDSDAAAVQLVTIHASKGLQYPVVYLPSLADRYVPKPTPPLFHDDDGRRCLDVGGGAGRLARPLADGGARRGGRRVAAPALRRHHPRPVPGRRLVGADPQHRRPRRCTGCCSAARPGHAEVPDASAVPHDDDAVGVFDAWRAARWPAAPSPPVPAPLGADARRSPPPGLAVPYLRPRRRHRVAPYVVLLADRAVEPRAPLAGGVPASPRRSPTDDEVPLPTASRRRRRIRAGDVAVADGRPAGRRRLRVAGPRRPRARRPRGARPGPRAPSCGRQLAEQLVLVAGRARPRRARRRRWSRCATPRSGPLAGDAHPARRSRCATGCASSTSSCRSPVATCGRTGDVAARRPRPLLRRHLPDGDPVRGYADALDRARARRPEPARLPHRLHRRGAAGA